MSLAALCAERVPTYHIEDSGCIDVEAGTIRHLPIRGKAEVVTPLRLARSPIVTQSSSCPMRLRLIA